MTEESPVRPTFDTSVPHSARIWNYWLGGKDHYPVDQVAGDAYASVAPQVRDLARSSRHFLHRTVRWLVGEARIRQLLDVGTGLPTVDNTHEVAQRVMPEARIVYVDNDPLVLAHARALLTSTSQGVTDYIDADLNVPDSIIEGASRTLDFDQPVGLMLMGVMGHVELDRAYAIVDRLMAALPSGSYLTMNDGTNTSASLNAAQQGYDDTGAVPYHLRSPEEVARFFHGLDLVEPGIVPIHEWRPEPSPWGNSRVDAVGGIGRKS